MNFAIVGAGGTVRIGDLALFVQPLPLRQEVSLYQELQRLAKSEMGDYLKPLEPMIDRLSSQLKEKPHYAATIRQIVSQAAEMEATRVLPGDDAVDQVRKTPKGAALEIWYRARPSHPSLVLRELETVITSVNVDDVTWQLRQAMSGGDDSGKVTTPSA